MNHHRASQRQGLTAANGSDGAHTRHCHLHFLIDVIFKTLFRSKDRYIPLGPDFTSSRSDLPFAPIRSDTTYRGL